MKRFKTKVRKWDEEIEEIETRVRMGERLGGDTSHSNWKKRMVVCADRLIWGCEWAWVRKAHRMKTRTPG